MNSAERVIFDTSTLIGALLVPRSAPRRALDSARQSCELCGSDATLAELGAVILRDKFDRYQDRATRGAFADLIRRCTRTFAVEPGAEAKLPQGCRDSRDDKFLALALVCHADCIVSSDADLTSMHPYHGVAILSAAVFLRRGGRSARGA